MRPLLVALATFLGLAVLAPPATATDWGTVWIDSTASDYCVAIGPAAGASPTQENCLDVGGQLWTVAVVGSSGGQDAHTIRNWGSGLCLTAIGTTTVQQSACGSATTQRWTLIGSGNTFRIANVSTGKCLARASQSLGAAVKQSTCNVVYGQWQLLF